MDKINITIESLVAIIDSNYVNDSLKTKAESILEFVLNTAIPSDLKKVQTHKNHQQQTDL